MKRNTTRRTIEDVLKCGEFVASGLTTIEVEENHHIPHSTVHWLIMNKLSAIDEELYAQCLVVLRTHRRNIKRNSV